MSGTPVYRLTLIVVITFLPPINPSPERIKSLRARQGSEAAYFQHCVHGIYSIFVHGTLSIIRVHRKYDLVVVFCSVDKFCGEHFLGTRVNCVYSVSFFTTVLLYLEFKRYIFSCGSIMCEFEQSSWAQLKANPI